jgi:hypothetical protein
VAHSDQVAKYLDKYGLVLVTNFRQYILMARVDGQPKHLEAFTLAPSAKAFWKALDHPAKFARDIGASFYEYLMRVLLQKAPLSTPKEVAWFLASYARDAKARIEAQPNLPGLAALRSG